jgi:hypothetical protein
VQTAKLSPVDLLLLLDASGSMAGKAGTRTRWELARDALAAFLADDRSRGLGVGLQLFPLHTLTCTDDGTCFLPAPGGCRIFSACLAPGAPLASGMPCGSSDDPPCPAGTTCIPLGRCTQSGADCVQMGQPCPGGPAGDTCGPRPRQCRFGPHARGSCDVADYQTPRVAIAPLPDQSPRLLAAIDGRLPIGGTPLAPAVKGALAHLAARPAGTRAVLVIITDGVPSGCGEAPAIAADLRAAAQRTPPLSTYVVGVFADDDPPAARATVDQLAMAGGAAPPFVLSASQDLSGKLLAALSAIRGAAVPCALAIPRPSSGQLDFAKVNVQVTAGSGVVDLTYVERADRCALAPDGWYYDVDPAQGTPARVQLCPAVCERIKADPQGSVQVRFGCKSRTIE